MPNRAAEALAASEVAYRLLADNSNEVVARADDELRYRYVSPACGRVYGWKAAQMIDRLVTDFVHPDDTDAVLAQHAMLLEDGKDRTVTYRIRRPHGRWMWVEGRLSLMQAPQGQAAGVLSTTRDISDRRRAEAASSTADKQFSDRV